MKEEMSFESAMKRLEEIVQMLENGNLPLEDSIKIFEEGIKLVRYCSKKLEEAERKVNILLKEGENYVQIPFVEKEEENKDGS